MYLLQKKPPPSIPKPRAKQPKDPLLSSLKAESALEWSHQDKLYLLLTDGEPQFRQALKELSADELRHSAEVLLPSHLL